MKFVPAGVSSQVLSIPGCGNASFKWDVPGLIVAGIGQVKFYSFLGNWVLCPWCLQSADKPPLTSQCCLSA